jgi:transcription antitermination factor NusG
MSHFNEGWYLIYTKPKHEKRVAENLTDANLTYLLPTIKKLRVWSDRRKYIDTPLFPSYVLEDYYQGLNAEGALYFVKFDKKVVRVKETIIDSIRLLVDQGTDIEVNNDYFRPGQQLQIYEGPLTGLTGEVVQVNGKEKILVRVHLLQRNLLATLPVRAVQPVPTVLASARL